jgi:hypothetical protein
MDKRIPATFSGKMPREKTQPLSKIPKIWIGKLIQNNGMLIFPSLLPS